jgi:hypothetical protein
MCFAPFIAAGSFLLYQRTRGETPSGTIHDWADARAADRAAVWRDTSE